MDLSITATTLLRELYFPVWGRKIQLDYHEGALEAIDGKDKKPEQLLGTKNNATVKAHEASPNLHEKLISYVRSII